MRIILTVLTIIVCLSPATAQDKPAYLIYTGKGKKLSYTKMLRSLSAQEAIMFGELHNNPIAHWLQLEVAKDLSLADDLVMGAEMFERDNQDALTAYVQGNITAKRFDSAARLWSNYATDYAPLVKLAKQKQFNFIATNIPRRYAAMVSRGGFDTLKTITEKEKEWIAPLPILYDSTLPGYQKMLNMMPGHASANFPKAQAIKDATMAYSIVQHLKSNSIFLHFNGAYHSDDHEGIVWYLEKLRPGLKVMTITTVLQKDVKKLEATNLGKADFIICVDEDMTTTY